MAEITTLLVWLLACCRRSSVFVVHQNSFVVSTEKVKPGKSLKLHFPIDLLLLMKQLTDEQIYGGRGSIEATELGTGTSASQGQEDINNEEDMSLMDLTVAEVMALTFETLEAAQSFYTTYSRMNGFGIRVRDVNSKMKRWVCCFAGKREERPLGTVLIRNPTPETRCNCKAGLRVIFETSSNRWMVTRFDIEHSHITVSQSMVHLLRHHRRITAADLTLINAMRDVGIRPCHIYKLMVQLNGGAANVGFMPKDMYNVIDKSKRDTVERGDFMKTVAYFDVKKECDLGFEYHYTLDKGGVLDNLFWCDSRSKIDYDCFGDLVMFDSTFGTNIYGRTLVLFIGVNNHHQTCISGSALLNGETTENYEWLLRKLLAAMIGKKPRSVMTDSDNAMREAIRRVFPKIPHRLCSWHLLRNAHQNIKQDDIGRAVWICMMAETKPEFEGLWRSMTEHFEITEHKWIRKMYNNREMWSCAYLKDAFYAGIHGNARAESMNFVTKCYINERNNLYELVRHYEQALEHIRDKENTADYLSIHTKAVSNQLLKSIDDSAAAVYTLKSLSVFRSELVGETLTIMRGNPTTCGMTTRYNVSVFGRPHIELTVTFNARDESAACDCKKFESTGFICRHIIFVLKSRDIRRLPEKCFMPRWTKDAKKHVDVVDDVVRSNELLKIHRRGMLKMACDELCKHAEKSTEAFTKVRNEIAGLSMWAKEKDQPPPPVFAHNAEPLHDPARVRVRRKEQELGPKPKKKKSRCSYCRSEHHRMPNCPTYREDTRASQCNSSEAGEHNQVRTAQGTPWRPPRISSSALATQSELVVVACTSSFHDGGSSSTM